MLYPSALSAASAYCLPSGQITNPDDPVVGGSFVGIQDCLRVILRGGHYFDAPLDAHIRAPQRLVVSSLRTGMLLASPDPSLPSDASRSFPYAFQAPDNKGNMHSYSGDIAPTLEQAELLGWLVGDGTITNERQSIRFTNKDTWCLSHVEQLTATAFPAVRVSWYAKNVGFDLTLTGGISNPLRHFLRMHQFSSGFPTAVGLYGKDQLLAFLRGLWGADGWASPRKKGTDVDMGLSRSNEDGYTSIVRFLHARIGMFSQRRECPTAANPNKHRLVFSGYRNYAVFCELVGQIGRRLLPDPPTRRPANPRNALWSPGIACHEAPIQRILRLPTPQKCYKVPTW